MKAILKVLLSLIVVYWVAVAATFTSIYVFPETAIHIAGAIESITEVVQDELPSSSLVEESSEEESSLVEESSEVTSEEEVISSSEEVSSEEPSSSEEVPASEPLRMNPGSEESSEEIVRCMAITPACGWELVITETEVLVLGAGDEIPENLEFYIAAESLEDENLFATLFLFDFDNMQWLTLEISLVQPEIIESGSLWFNQELGIVSYAEWVDVWVDGGVDPLPEEEVVLEYTQEEITEAVHKVEQFLFESMLTLVPLSFLIMFLNSKADLYTAEHKEEIEAEIAEKKAAKAAKKAKKLAAKPVKKAKLGFKLPSFKLSFKSKKASAPKPVEVIKEAPKAKTIKIGLTGIEVKKK